MASLLINQGTNAAVNFDLAGTINTQVIAVGYGTLSALGTLPNLPGGSVAITAGTITSDTVVGGTLNLVGSNAGMGTLSNIGSLAMLNAGTITALPNIPGGTLSSVTSLANGSIHVTAGTEIITSGSIAVIAGTIATLGTMGTLGLVNTVTAVSSLTNGSIHVTAGTEVITSGSIAIVAGTIGAGTFNLNPLGGSVLTTAVAIGSAAGTAAIPGSSLTNRKALIAYNVGTSTVYIGGTGVATTSGIPIGTGQYTPSFDLGTGSLYGIAGGPGGTLIALEIS